MNDSLSIDVIFSEPMDSSSIMDPALWIVRPGDMLPHHVTGLLPDYSLIRISFSSVFVKGVMYSVSGSPGMLDCVGNPMSDTSDINLAIPDEVDCTEIIINEILFNPFPGGARFVELFNRSDHVFDLREVVVLYSDTTNGFITDQAKLITENPFLIFPFDYVVITPDSQDIANRYRPFNTDVFIQMSGFPMLNNKQGKVMLFRKHDQLVIDQFDYSETMHYPLLSSVDGVSLERISSERASLDPRNWHSAASNVGFATPGYQNSQSWKGENDDQTIQLNPSIFSPDNDGKQDILQIFIRPPGPGYLANIELFDARGKHILTLVNNVLLANNGEFVWDGVTENNQKAPIGYYVIFIELMNPEGTITRYKKTVVIAGKY